jgi:hypothetical protein
MQIGIDLGGTTIEGGALHADTLVAVRRRVGTPRNYAGTAARNPSTEPSVSEV